ncbi:hypothetical protein MKZ17_03740 [Solibacillus sp. FSL R7-0682]|uniref:hypothetical protein n=1 Tax=Solibacillus sp. FSL R7-0682 TaxID=2921690 RepID=UPI0030F92ECB
MTNALTGKEYNGLHRKVRRQAIAQKHNFVVVDDKPYDLEGEYLGDKFRHELVPIRTEAQQRFIESKKVLGDHEAENGGFVFTFFKQSRTINERFPSLVAADIARLMYLATFSAWKTGRVQYDNGRVIDRKAVEEMFKLSERRARQLFERFISEGILSEQDGAVYVNQSVFYRGSISDAPKEVTDLKYTRMFKDTVRDLYEKSEGKTIAQLALVYSIMPFLHFGSNAVCHNPDEVIDEQIELMTLDELAVLLEYKDAAKLKTAMNKVKIGGKPVFGFFENPNDRRTKRIVVNPRAVYAGDGKQLAAIKILFN